MRPLAFTLSIILFAVQAEAHAQPGGKSLLGMTEDEVAKKLGPPDETATAQHAKGGEKPRSPVARIVIYRPKSIGWARVGFDEKGIARSIDPGAGRPWPERIPAISNLVSASWTPEPEIMLKIFPPASTKIPVIRTFRIPGIKIWEISSRGKNEIFPYQLPGGFAETGTMRLVASNKGRTAYTIGDVRVEATDSYCQSLYIADADTFWAWTFEDLFTLYRNGFVKKADDDKPGKIVKPKSLSMEQKYAALSQVYSAKAAASRRLSVAVMQVVKNTSASLAPAQRAAQLLRERYDQTLSQALVEALKSDNKTIRERAVMIASQLDDPALLDPLIGVLAGRLATPGAVESLKTMTGQDLGVEPEAWKQWLKDNRKKLQDAHLVRRGERAGEQAMVTGGAKQYHLGPACPALNPTLPYQALLLSEAREKGLQPCPKCNPIK